jgi:hypothetical protein
MDKQGLHGHHFQFQSQVFSFYTEHVSPFYLQSYFTKILWSHEFILDDITLIPER